MEAYNKIEISGITKEYNFKSKLFKQFEVQEYIELPKEKPDAEEIIKVAVSAKVTSTKIISTPCSISNEGQRLTGSKLIVQGNIFEKIEYIASDPTQSVHAAEFSKPFSSFIMLDKCKENFTYDVNCYIEDVYVKQIDKRKIFKNIMLLLNAVPLNYPADNSLLIKDHEYVNCKTGFFSQFTVEETAEVPKEKPDIEEIISTIVDPEIISIKFINTIRGKSLEGQQLTGKKAVIELKFKQKILYVACRKEQSVHGFENVFYTSAYVVVPRFYEGTDLEYLLKKKLIKTEITLEDIFVRKIDNRKVFKNICVFLNLKFEKTFELCYLSRCNCHNKLFMSYEDGSLCTPIFCYNDAKLRKPRWSPIGDSIIFIEEKGLESSFIKADYKTLKATVLGNVHNFEKILSYTFAKNCNKIFFSALRCGNKDIFVLDMINNTTCKITNSDGNINYSSPKYCDGNKILAFIKSIGGLNNICFMDTLGNETGKITSEGFIKDFAWDNTGKDIYYISDKSDGINKIYLLNTISLKTKLLVDRDFDKIKKVKCSKNSIISFIGEKNGTEDIYLYDLLNKKLCNITKNNDYIKVMDYAWDISGSKIYYECREYGYSVLLCIMIENNHIRQITNPTKGRIEIDYRPVIR